MGTNNQCCSQYSLQDHAVDSSAHVLIVGFTWLGYTRAVKNPFPQDYVETVEEKGKGTTGGCCLPR